jgi:hypothetical protein
MRCAIILPPFGMGGCFGWLARHRMKACYDVSFLLFFTGPAKRKIRERPGAETSGFFRIWILLPIYSLNAFLVQVNDFRLW